MRLAGPGIYSGLLAGWVWLCVLTVAAAEVTLQPVASPGKWPAFSRGNFRSIEVVSNIAYVAANEGGFQIFDVSNPAAPIFIGGMEGPQRIIGLDVVGPYAYLAAQGDGLLVVDITDPTQPRRLRLPRRFPASAGDVTVEGNRAYVMTGALIGSPLDILDVTSPTNITSLGRPCCFTEVRSIVVTSNLAFVAGGTNGVLVLDVSDPTRTRILASRTGTDVRALALGDGYVYVAEAGLGLAVLTFNGSNSLAFVNRIGLGFASAISAMHFQDGWLYLAGHARGFHVVDVRTPNLPVLAFQEPLVPNTDALDVAVTPQAAFIADSFRGLRAFAITNPATPVLIGAYTNQGLARNVYAAGQYAYLADELSGLHIFDVSNPSAPLRVGGYADRVSVWGVRVAGNRAYVGALPINAANEGTIWSLLVFDVTHPPEPVLLGTHHTTNAPQRFEIVDQHVFIPAFSSGLLIFDVSDPTNLVKVTSYDTPGVPFDLRIVDGLAYIADGSNGLQILDVRNVAAPAAVGRWPTPSRNALDIELALPYAYLATTASRLEIIDVSDPANPIGIANLAGFGAATAMQLLGDRLFLISALNGLLVLNVSSPTNPVVIARFDTTGTTRGLFVDNSRIFLADGDAGLVVLPSVRGQQFTIRIDGPPGTPLTLQYRTALGSGNDWSNILSTNLPSDPFYFTDPDVSSAQKFYRATEP